MPDQGIISTTFSDATIVVRLSPEELKTLETLAANRGLSRDEYAASLLFAQVTRSPRWNPEEIETINGLANAVRQIERLARLTEDPAGIVEGSLPAMLENVTRSLEGIQRKQRGYWGIAEEGRAGASAA